MKPLIFLPILLVYCFLISGQKVTSISQALANADTVFIISHQTVPSIFNRLVDSIDGLFINDKLNSRIVVEKFLLNKKQINELTTILTMPEPVLITEGGCFDPHHAILIKSKEKISYMEICFKCHGYITSSDLAWR